MTTPRLLASPRPTHRPTSRPATPAALAVAALTAALVSGCSQATTGATGSGSTSTSDAAVVGQCVRDRGYDVDDSSFTSPGTFPQPSGLTADQLDAYGQAVSDCVAGTSLETPDGTGGFGPENDRQLLDLTACLRDAGFPDVADPVDGVWSPDASHEGDPAYEAATETCAAEAGLQAG